MLAAGGSTRLGSPKQLLTIGGCSLVRRTVELAASAGALRVVAVVGAHSARICREIEDLPCEIVENNQWHKGIGSSLDAAAPHATSGVDSVLVLGVDQPALTSSHIAHLLVGASSSKSGAAAAIHREHAGIPAVIPASWFGGLLRHDAGYRRNLAMLPAGKLSLLVAPELELDVDTWSDVKRAVDRGWLDERCLPHQFRDSRGADRPLP